MYVWVCVCVCVCVNVCVCVGGGQPCYLITHPFTTYIPNTYIVFYHLENDSQSPPSPHGQRAHGRCSSDASLLATVVAANYDQLRFHYAATAIDEAPRLRMPCLLSLPLRLSLSFPVVFALPFPVGIAAALVAVLYSRLCPAISCGNRRCPFFFLYGLFCFLLSAITRG